MAEQYSLAGFDEPAAPTDRLFFALCPDPATAQRIAQIAQSLRQCAGLKGKPLEPERLHITLHHLGDTVGLPTQVVAAATQAAEGLGAAAFDVSFERAESFAGRARARPFVLRGEVGLVELLSFQQLLGVAMAKAGLGRWVEPRFTPHVTLLYDDQLVGPQAIEPVGWRVTEFVLVHSLLGQHKHVMLGRWPLRS
jgi:2'-5' RNA ligase